MIYQFVVTETVLSDETSTHFPVNRGAARQMFGSGSLRQTGSGPILVGTTTSPMNREKDNHQTKNDMKHDEKSMGPEDLPEHHEGKILPD